MQIYNSIYGKTVCVVDILGQNKSVGNNTSCTSLCGVSATLLANIDVCVLLRRCSAKDYVIGNSSHVFKVKRVLFL